MSPDAHPFGLKPGAIGAMRAVFAAHAEVEQAILYGSRALGNYRPGSDIDLVLDGAALTLPLLLAIEIELDDLLLPYKIDLSIRAHIDNPELISHIARHGAVFYRRAEST